MKDLTSHRLIWFKGILFLLLGTGAATVLLVDGGNPRKATLLALAIWGFCRAYYFAFYVIEHYVDPGFRFSGLLNFAAYVLRRRRSRD